MKLSIRTIEKHFAPRLWFIANHHAVGIWDAADIYQELLIRIHQHDFPSQPTKDRVSGKVLPFNPAHVNRFMSSRAMDIRRLEIRRRRKVTGPIVKPEAFADRRDRLDESIYDLFAELLNRLPDNERIIIQLIVRPSDDVLQIATKEQKKALREKAKGKLKMNVVGPPKIANKHVGQFLGFSPAHVSRVLTHAKQVAQDVLQEVG